MADPHPAAQDHRPVDDGASLPDGPGARDHRESAADRDGVDRPVDPSGTAYGEGTGAGGLVTAPEVPHAEEPVLREAPDHVAAVDPPVQGVPLASTLGRLALDAALTVPGVAGVAPGEAPADGMAAEIPGVAVTPRTDGRYDVTLALIGDPIQSPGTVREAVARAATEQGRAMELGEVRADIQPVDEALSG